MDQAGRKADKDSERTCIVTREIRAPSQMLRFVVGPDGDVVPDLRRNLPGRGVWVSAEAVHVAQAVKRQLFAKAFKDKVRASASLPEDIDRLLEQQALQALSICNKAGLVTAGSAKIEKVLGSAPVAALLHATDGSADGVRKVGQVVTRTKGEAAAKLPRIILFVSSQLDLALGRSNVIHAALKSGAASEAFLERCRRLVYYRGGMSGENTLGRLGISGPDASGVPVVAGADDRNQRGGGPDHCDDQSEKGSGANVMTSGHVPRIETI